MVTGAHQKQSPPADSAGHGVLRPDIQALRGVAILLVSLYHFEIGPFAAGFLGVDIFFVISGYAMHLVPGLVSQRRATGLVQATRSACGPLLGVAPRRLAGPQTATVYDRTWAESCIEFNDSVLAYLRQDEGNRTVAISRVLAQYLDSSKTVHVLSDGAGYVEASESSQSALAGLLRTVAEVRGMGRKIVLFAPPPSADFDVDACLERKLSGRLAMGATENCLIPHADYLQRKKSVIELVDAVEQRGLPVIRSTPCFAAHKPANPCSTS